MKEFSAELFRFLEECQCDHLTPLPFSLLKKDIMAKDRSTQKYKTNRAICPVYEFFSWKEKKG